MAAATPVIDLRHDEPAAPRAARFPFMLIALVTLLYGGALFAVNNLFLDVLHTAWQEIQVIQGSFAPLEDARRLYQSAANTKAVDSTGTDMPGLSQDGKVRPYDLRIVGQASQERQLKGPDTFKNPPPD
jgi:hypothetical protein